MARVGRKLRDHGFYSGGRPDVWAFRSPNGKSMLVQEDAVVNYLWRGVAGRSGWTPLAGRSRERVPCAWISGKFASNPSVEYRH